MHRHEFQDEQFAALFAAVYPEVRRLVARQLRCERRNPTFTPTEIVHEVFLRLVDYDDARQFDRNQLLAAATRIIRNLLVDLARRRLRAKRGGGWRRVTLTGSRLESPWADDLLLLNDALEALLQIDPRRARVVELRYFGGLTVDETADVLGVSPRTVEADWRFAAAWLARRLS